jgi:hypothetical protein
LQPRPTHQTLPSGRIERGPVAVSGQHHRPVASSRESQSRALIREPRMGALPPPKNPPPLDRAALPALARHGGTSLCLHCLGGRGGSGNLRCFLPTEYGHLLAAVGTAFAFDADDTPGEKRLNLRRRIDEYRYRCESRYRDKLRHGCRSQNGRQQNCEHAYPFTKRDARQTPRSPN